MPSSDNLTIDLTNYKDRTGSRVTPGRYRVQVEDAETATASTGNPMVNLWFRIIGGEFDGQTIVDRLVLTEKSLFRVVGFMQAIGLPTPKKRLQVRLEQFIGRTLEIDLEDGDPYNGRVKSEVRGYLRVAKPAQQKDSGDDLDGLVAEGEGIGGTVAPDLDGQAPSGATSPTAGENALAKTGTTDASDEVDLDAIDL